jgi:HEAT repeat protein
MSLSELEKHLYGDDWDAAKQAAEDIARENSIEARSIIFRAIKSCNVHVRNAAALAVREEKIQDSVPYLIESIMNKDNENQRGTMVYALESLDCRELFDFLFRLALEANYECRSIACDILWDQGFMVSDQDIDDAEAFLNQWEETQDYRDDDEILFKHLRQVISELRNG